MSSVVASIPRRPREVGGLAVRRVLPVAARRAVGPFVFLDHLGPHVLAPGQGLDVDPHPHIGLSTVTYLFEGAIVHRDSLGSVATITPGDNDWMTAGRGLVHAERSTDAMRASGGPIHGLQLWVALPWELETSEPTFEQHRRESLPEARVGGALVRVLAGEAYGVTSPVTTRWPLFFAEAWLEAGEGLSLPTGHAERALYVVSGAVAIDGEPVAAHTMAVAAPSATRAVADSRSRVVLLGGAPLAEARHMDWNFVSSSRELIERAKDDWQAQRFPRIPTDDAPPVPLPAYPPRRDSR